MSSSLKSRLAISLTFFANGCLGSTWLVHIPGLKTRLGLTDGKLGVALWAVAAGLFLGMVVSGTVIARFGTRAGTLVATVCTAIALTLPVAAPSYFWLFPALLVYGVFNGLMDACMNGQAAHLQIRLGRPIMSSIHACWSIGSFFGAAVGGTLIAARVAPLIHAAVIGSLFVIATFWIRLQLLEDQEWSADTFHIALPKGPLLPLAIICFIAMMSEGAVADWSGVHLKESFGKSTAIATLGNNIFFFMMFLSRLLGEWVIQRLGATRTAVVGLVLATGGFAIASWANHFVLALLGFGLAGFGVANTVPLIFASAAAQGRGLLGHSIAAVATVGYLGFFAGPPMIGALADIFGLPMGLLAVGGMLAIAAGLSAKVLVTNREATRHLDPVHQSNRRG
jgi:MFS family permease